MKSEPMHPQWDAAALARASRALWLATLSLMTAYVRTGAPAHRYLLASRIARNFGLLREQDCFSEDARASFSRLAARWRDTAEEFSPDGHKTRGMLARLQRALSRAMH